MESISAAHRFSLWQWCPFFQNRFSCSAGIELLRHEQCIHSGAINGDDWPFYIRSFARHSLYHCNVPLGILSKITGSHGSSIILVGRGELKFSFCCLCLEPNRQRALITRICGSVRPMWKKMYTWQWLVCWILNNSGRVAWLYYTKTNWQLRADVTKWIGLILQEDPSLHMLINLL